jgi:phage terminase small subunit
VDGRRQLFVREYFLDKNASRATKAAGFSPSMAAQLLREPSVMRALEELTRKKLQSLERDGERVLNEFGAIGFSDVRKLFGPGGGLLPPDQWPEDIAPAVASVEVDELYEGRGKDREQVGWTKKIKLWNKTDALKALGENLKLFDKTLTVRLESMTDEERALRAEALIAAGLARALEKTVAAQAVVEVDAVTVLPPHEEDDLSDLL